MLFQRRLCFFCVQRINEKPQVVNDYESGRAIPNQQVISKLERAVGVKLRGKDMGQPLHTGPKKKWHWKNVFCSEKLLLSVDECCQENLGEWFFNQSSIFCTPLLRLSGRSEARGIAVLLDFKIRVTYLQYFSLSMMKSYIYSSLRTKSQLVVVHKRMIQ